MDGFNGWAILKVGARLGGFLDFGCVDIGCVDIGCAEGSIGVVSYGEGRL